MKSVSATAFIHALFQHTDDKFGVYFCSLPNARDDPKQPGERRVLTREVEVVERFIARWDQQGRALYFCVSTMTGKRNKANANEIAGAHGEIDFKDHAVSEEDIWKAIVRLRCQPTAIVRSGHGLHLYWLFHEPMEVQGNIERIEQALRQLCDMIGGDPQVCEVARLMRLPGTHNTKGGEWLEVTVERIDGPRYELDDLEEWLSESAPVLRRRAATPAQPIAGNIVQDNPFLQAALALGFKPPVDVEQRLAAMTYGGDGDSSIHFTQLSVSASLLSAGQEVQEVVDILMTATRAAAGEYGTRWNWGREEKALRRMCETWLLKHPPGFKRVEQPMREPKASPASDAENTEDVEPGAATVIDMGAARAKRKAKPKGNTPVHIILAEALLAVLEQRGERVMFTDKGSYRYRDGLWSLETDPGMQSWLDTEIEACARGLSMDSASRLINEARKWIIRNPDLRREDVAWDAHGMVPTSSGLVHPRTGKLTPPDPAQYVTWRTSCGYDPAAECPLWQEMIGSVFADREPDVKAHYLSLLQEMAGAGLIDVKAKALSKALVLWGGQDSGKSGLIEVISGLYGEERNTTTLASLDQNHGTMGFLHRRPWVLYEAFEQNVWHLSAVVKTLISGEPISINVKNGPILSRRYYAPILWATNHAPQFKEATKAIVQRMVILQCRQNFDGDNPVGVALKAQRLGFESPNALVITTEMEGVLAWAVEGLRRCLTRGHFHIPAEAIEVGHQVRLDSNIVAEFMESCVDFDPDAMISTADFSAAHSSWWLEHKGEDRRAPSNDSIGRALRALGEQRIATDKVEMRDMSRRYYGGVSLNTEGLRHWKNAVTSEAFIFQGKKASTSDPTDNPFKPIPKNWQDRVAVKTMRAAHIKSYDTSQDRSDMPRGRGVMDASSVMDPKEVSSKVSSSVMDDEVPDPPDDIYFR